MSFDLYQAVTDQIVSLLEKGVVPWRSPILGKSFAGRPKNLVSGKQYRGVNIFLLAMTAHMKGYSSACWLSFNQAKERGGMVRKGERATMVVFWKKFDVVDKATGERQEIPLLRHYNVFNVEQCDGIQPPDVEAFTPSAFSPEEQAEKIIRDFEGGPKIEHGGSRAFYRPIFDSVHIPEPTRFSSVSEYYSTLFHELGHSTGHSTRLSRQGGEFKPFGSEEYSKEELTAEMSAAFLCAECGILPAVIHNQAAYMAGWLKRLKEDKKLLIMAAGQAQRAADWIRNHRWEKPAGGDQNEPAAAAEDAN